MKIGVGIGGSSVKIGDRVGVSWVRDSCGECTPCIRGDETRCEKQIHSGRVVDGTLAQYTVVPFRHLICLPEGLPDEQIAPIMCAGVTAYKALKICGAIPGQWVVISGAGGGVGAMAIQYAHAMGYRVLAIDAGEQKSEYCLRLQAEAYLNILEHQNLASVVNQITGSQGAAAVLVAAGSAQAYQDAFDMLAAFGTLVCVGIPAPDQRVGFHPLKFIDKGIRVIGSMVGSKGDIQEALQFVERHVVVPEVQTIRMDDISSLMPLFTSDQVCLCICLQQQARS